MVIRTLTHMQKTPRSRSSDSTISLSQSLIPEANMMVRKGGFEPPRLSAPPPQDGVSASSTTSARCNYHALNKLNRSAFEGISGRTGFCTDLLHSTRVSGCAWLPPVRQTASQPHPRAAQVVHGGLHAIVSRNVLQWKRSECCRATARNVCRSARGEIADMQKIKLSPVCTFVWLLCMPHGWAAAKTETWHLDPPQSAAQFSVRHMGISTVRGTFTK